jgi:signal transduction histidine kinase
MVRRIIEAHGSHIKVDSVVGKGSRFEFALPSSHQAKPSLPIRRNNPGQ